MPTENLSLPFGSDAINTLKEV